MSRRGNTKRERASGSKDEDSKKVKKAKVGNDIAKIVEESIAKEMQEFTIKISKVIDEKLGGISLELERHKRIIEEADKEIQKLRSDMLTTERVMTDLRLRMEKLENGNGLSFETKERSRSIVVENVPEFMSNYAAENSPPNIDPPPHPHGGGGGGGAHPHPPPPPKNKASVVEAKKAMMRMKRAKKFMLMLDAL